MVHFEIIRPDPIKLQRFYADLFQIGLMRMKIEADFSVRPKRLLLQTYEGDCKWAATAP